MSKKLLIEKVRSNIFPGSKIYLEMLGFKFQSAPIGNSHALQYLTVDLLVLYKLVSLP